METIRIKNNFSFEVSPALAQKSINQMEIQKTVEDIQKERNDKVMKVALPSFEKKKELKEAGSGFVPLNDRIFAELEKFEKMITDDQYERMLEQMFKIIALAAHHLKQEEKEYVLNQIPVLREQMEKVKKTYNTSPQLILTIISSSLTILGGVGSGISTIPAIPDLLKTVGDGMSTAGQGTGGLGKIADNSALAERTGEQFSLEGTKYKREHVLKNEKNSENRREEIKRLRRECLDKLSQVITRLLNPRT